MNLEMLVTIACCLEGVGQTVLKRVGNQTHLNAYHTKARVFCFQLYWQPK